MAINYDDDNNYGFDEPEQPYDYSPIKQSFKKYLGRDASQQELEFHAKDPQFDYHIKSSPEAQAWAAKSQQPAQGGYQQSAVDAFNAAVMGGKTSFTPQELAAFGGNISAVAGSTDKYNLGNGQMVDILRDQGGANEKAWHVSGGKYGVNGEVDWSKVPGSSVYGGGKSGQSSSSSVSSSSTGVGGNLDPMRDQLIKQLMQRAAQGLDIKAATDPNIRAQADPYAAAQERQRRNYLADMAESQGPLANLQGEERLAMERAGQATGLFEAQLVGRELEARRAEIQDALTQMRGMLTTTQEMELRKQLAQLDDATKRLGLRYQNEQAAGQLQLGQNALGLNYSQFDWLRDPSNPNNIPNFNG